MTDTQREALAKWYEENHKRYNLTDKFAAMVVWQAALAHSQWISVDNELPPEGLPLTGYNPLWVDMDFNPKGIREFSRYGDGTQYTSAKWNNDQDCWVATDEAPTHWQHQPQPPITNRKDE